MSDISNKESLISRINKTLKVEDYALDLGLVALFNDIITELKTPSLNEE